MTATGGRDAIAIARLVDLEAAGCDGRALRAGIARIFRDTVARWPDDAAAARAFQDLWLDQYVSNERDMVWLAHDPDTVEPVAGYLVGCTTDPAQSPRFASLSYFKTFAALCADYPAHLHINVAAGCRGRRIGERLVAAFTAQLAAARVPGVHVVTGRDQRNVGFYRRLGFRELASAPRNTTEVLFLAKAIP